MTALRQPKADVNVPEITDERLAELNARFRPLVLKDGELHRIAVKKVKLRNTAFAWSPVLLKEVEFMPLREVETDHTCAYHAFVKPTIAEVLAQVPDDIDELANAFYIDFDSVYYYPSGGGHRLKTVFGIISPEDAADLDEPEDEADKPRVRRKLDDEMERFLDGVVAVVDATSNEQFLLWEKYHHTRGVPWESSRFGLGQCVGRLDDRPVCISLCTAEVQGRKLLFVDATSEVVDHLMIDKWLYDCLPDTAFRNGDRQGYLNRTDAGNFFNVLRD